MLIIDFFLQNSTDYKKIEKTALKIADREQKLLTEMAQLNLLNNSKLTVSKSYMINYFRIQLKCLLVFCFLINTKSSITKIIKKVVNMQ